MALENVLIYEILTGDNTYPHSGSFTVGVAGQITVDDSNGSSDAIFGDLTHTGGGDVADQDVTASTVSGINVSDTVDLRYQYTYTGSDGSSGTIYFIATNSTANYGPRFAADAPLSPGVTYTVGTFNTDGAAPYSSLVPCFTMGTLIMTNKGYVPIEALNVGDRIHTRDCGFQPLCWIGRCTVPATDELAPIEFAKGLLGNDDTLLVSPNHRMLINAASNDLLFGENEVFVPAKHLLGNEGVQRRFSREVTYFHLLFEEHQIVMSNGAPSESFFPGENGLNSLDCETRAEVLSMFPDLERATDAKPIETARICLKANEARILQLGR